MKQIMLILLVVFSHSRTQEYSSSITVKGTVFNRATSAPLSGVLVQEKNTKISDTTDSKGRFSLQVSGPEVYLIFEAKGFNQVTLKATNKTDLKVYLTPIQEVADEEAQLLQEVVITGAAPRHERKSLSYSIGSHTRNKFNTEEYAFIKENGFLDPARNPLSTFSIDVDAASYSNMRRFLQQGQQPPKDAVRIEEMINYFRYDYPQPEHSNPFSVNTELSKAPWQEDHYLLHIGLQGRQIPSDDLPPSNLVFLIDVSGSMDTPNKLGLLKSAFKLLVDQLRPQDKVSIVVYAGAAGVVLTPTNGDRRQTILNALQELKAGGSTAGGAGIKQAYSLAEQHFLEGGNNRIILATDGDFNIGVSSNAEMRRLVESKRDKGVYLTVLGFGMGNYKDSKMEILADHGNGNYAYIDNITEARKVLVKEFGGTLFTIAKDVKLQLEFNPAKVKAYRLIGYENRLLESEDFNNDKKDAGEMGSGHTVTALYEIIPAENAASDHIRPVDPLKYQSNTLNTKTSNSNEVVTIKLRYKNPGEKSSNLMQQIVKARIKPWDKTSDNFRWSAAVASFGMLLRNSDFKGHSSFEEVTQWAQAARGADLEGYRSEFINLVRSTELLVKN